MSRHYFFLVVPISGDILSCLETDSTVSCSYSEVPAAQQKIPRCGSGEPADHACGWPLGSSGAKQLRVSPGSASVLRIRRGHLYGHRRRRRQQQQRRRQVRRLQPEMRVRLRLICGRSSDESVEIASRLCLHIGGNNRTEQIHQSVRGCSAARPCIQGDWVVRVRAPKR